MSPDENYILTMPGAIDKFLTAGQIANESMKDIIELCTPNKWVYEIIVEGMEIIKRKLEKVYINKKLEKGLAFPISININSVCCYFSPL